MAEQPKRDTPPIRITLDRSSMIPMFRQIYGAIREEILSGRLAAGSRLPPSRELAADLAVSRTTAVLALEHLEAEGYVDGRGAAGTFVVDLVLPSDRSANEKKRFEVHPPAAEIVDKISVEAVPFRLGEPALDLFPSKLWARLYARCSRDEGRSLLGYGDPHGYL
ncbi:MAG: GntR family transcriptional regulator, partial [Thermoanaerobaculia bacterium]